MAGRRETEAKKRKEAKKGSAGRGEKHPARNLAAWRLRVSKQEFSSDRFEDGFQDALRVGQLLVQMLIDAHLLQHRRQSG